MGCGFRPLAAVDFYSGNTYCGGVAVFNNWRWQRYLGTVDTGTLHFKTASSCPLSLLWHDLKNKRKNDYKNIYLGRARELDTGALDETVLFRFDENRIAKQTLRLLKFSEHQIMTESRRVDVLSFTVVGDINK